MKNIFSLAAVLLLSGWLSPLWAAKEAGVTPRVEDSGTGAGFPALPGVIISPGRSTAQFEEYRYNGRLYMVKVTPRKGYAYYLVDSSGDGLFDARHSNLQSQVVVPQWVLKRW